MARPFVSVLIDTYNHERFIEQALVSAVEQDFPASEREVIVVDDGSTDRTPEILRTFASAARIIRKANGGQASAFNVGIPECRGEFIAFLDGDDWWAPGKLVAVTKVLQTDPAIGLLGHGITEVYSDGRTHTELIRENPRFRLDSKAGARVFRLRKSFLGTSRMTCRSDVLKRIGRVPEELTFEADEYVFTLAGLFADVNILRESFTFYRLHEANRFLIQNGNAEGTRRKYRILTALAKVLEERFTQEGLPDDVAQIVLESVRTEADLLRLSVDGGYPWETISAELRNYRINYDNTTNWYWFLKILTLLPACVLPPRRYYSLRQRLTDNKLYRKVRQEWLPFSEPAHVERYRGARS